MVVGGIGVVVVVVVVVVVAIVVGTVGRGISVEDEKFEKIKYIFVHVQHTFSGKLKIYTTLTKT